MGPRAVIGAVVAAAIASIAAAPALAAPPVTNTNDSGPGSLRQAIIGAAPGDTIPIPAGIYTLTSGELAIATSLTLAGHSASDTTLQTNGSSRVFHASGASSTISISDVTVRDGQVTATGSVAGGGIFNDGANLTLTRLLVIDNRAIADGAPGASGGIADGGGIDSTGPLTVIDSVVAGNDASAVGGAGKFGGITEGGGIASFGPLEMVGTLVAHNTADARGGQGASDAGQGGGIADGGGLRIQRNSDAGADVSSSTFVGNVADASGGPGAHGGIAQGGGSFLVTNGPDVTGTDLTVTQNLARAEGGGAIAEGGGLFWGANDPGRVFLTNDTITDNAAAGPDANGATSDRRAGNALIGSRAFVRNTIISGGIADPGTENCSQTPVSSGHNIDSLDQCGFHASGDGVNVDPRLGPLQDNGGPVPTQAVSPGTPPFDTGDNLGCPPTDARGLPRPQGVACDIGAFELEQADLSVTHSPPPSVAASTRQLTYTVAVRNAGTGTAHASTLTDAPPPGTTLVTAIPSSGTCAGTAPVTCSLGEIPQGATATVTVVVRAVAPGTFPNSATASTTTFDANAANNASTASATLAASGGGPGLRKVGIVPATFRLGTRLPHLARKVPTGTTIRFTLNEAARVTLTFRRAAAGRRGGRRCVKPTGANRRHRRCTRFVVAGRITVSAHGGANRLRFQGRLSRHRALTPGRYRVTLVARDAAGRASRPVTAGFRLLPRR